MQQNITIEEAATSYLSKISGENRKEYDIELNRFVWWFGNSKFIDELKPLNIEDYANWILTITKDPSKKLEPVRAFLTYLKKGKFIDTNLSIHVRAKKAPAKTFKSSKKVSKTAEIVTKQGKEKLQDELNELKKERTKTIEEVTRAAADKDFRENAPLEAAREHHGRVETRIRELESTLKTAEVIESQVVEKNKIHIGCKVTLNEKSRENKLTFIIVSPSEMDIAKGKISVLSPIGKSLLDHCEGEEVEVIIPRGKLVYIIQRVEI